MLLLLNVLATSVEKVIGWFAVVRERTELYMFRLFVDDYWWCDCWLAKASKIDLFLDLISFYTY